MKLRLRLDDREITATLIDSESTQDFVSLLTLDDLLGREKVARLPRAIARGERSHGYQVGDIAIWPPGPDFVIFFRQDGQEIPDPGITVIGRIDSGVEALEGPGSRRVTVELARGALR